MFDTTDIHHVPYPPTWRWLPGAGRYPKTTRGVQKDSHVRPEKSAKKALLRIGKKDENKFAAGENTWGKTKFMVFTSFFNTTITQPGTEEAYHPGKEA